jgi:hypothetical protein
MTDTSGIVGVGSVVAAHAKLDTLERTAAAFIPQIIEAHKQVVAAERSGHGRNLELAIAAGDLLLAAKEAVKGQFKWTAWRSEHLPDVPQVTASLYMRLAANKERFRPTTEDGRRINNAVVNLAAEGNLSIRKAASLLVTRTRNRTSTGRPTRTRPENG